MISIKKNKRTAAEADLEDKPSSDERRPPSPLPPTLNGETPLPAAPPSSPTTR